MHHAKLVQTSHYQSAQKQSLRGVHLYAPTVIWVSQGKKRLWWRDQELIFTSLDWLLVPASQQLVFINEPENNRYFARSLSFFHPPPVEWITHSATKANEAKPKVSMTASLGYCFNLLYEMENKHLSQETKKHLLFAFYAELKNASALHLLFPNASNSLTDRLAQFLSFNPGESHKVGAVAEHFLMSRATFIRKLALEGSSFRKILTNTRMLYSLDLIQRSQTLLSIAITCGYQSEARFSHRFKQTFGLTPYAYSRTL